MNQASDQPRSFDLDRLDIYVIDEDDLLEKIENHSKIKQYVIYDQILELLKLLPKEMIRTNDATTSYDIVSKGVFQVRAIAKLIKSTFAYIYNDGDYYHCVKSLQTIRFKDGDVQIPTYRNMGGESGNTYKTVFQGNNQKQSIQSYFS